ncbi:PE-PPE domain-containing protein [Nocardioides albertanoniae]|uniref:PE-PPE domain-containing protein n=1 Tax=Nocardioides albertanoniae TaxID=1175486 RepID=A0A543A273_9ACTN|nr:PE-PPE domain-containing protein [Nocardioides albertanoniae]TQL66691.1 PE-PPE domain-containing protein [Nocardioides albertanoniae]
MSSRRFIRSLILFLGAVAAALPGAVTSAPPASAANGTTYYVLIGGTCDGPANVYRDEWLRGGIPLRVDYPAGGQGTSCPDQTPMNESVQIGRRNAIDLIRANYSPDSTFVVVGYSQGAIVANLVLNDLADGQVPGVDKSRFQAKLYADPMQPAGPAGAGIGAVVPAGSGVPFTGWVSPGAGRSDFGGIPYIRYCIETDGICNFDAPLGAGLGGYFAQHWCYQWDRPTDHRSIMGDSIADGVYINDAHRLGKQDCKPPYPA